MRRVWCFVVVCFVVLGVVQPATAQSGESENPGDGSGGDSPGVVMLADDPAVLSLVDEFGISVEQAVGQMVSQVAAGDAEAALPKRLRKVFAGRSIFHDRGGVVEVGVTDRTMADRMKAHFIKFGVGRVKVRVFDHSQDEIDEMIDEKRLDLERELEKNAKAKNGKKRKRAVAIGQKELGKISVEQVPGELEPEEAEFVAEAEAEPTLFTVEEVDELPEGAEVACDWSGDIECDPPLRGSQFMEVPSGGTCTVGFNVRSRTDRKPYVLTAGHCLSGRWQTRFEDGSIHTIGSTHRRLNNRETDAGIIRVDNPSGWRFGQPWITVDPTGRHAAQSAYRILRTRDPKMNDRVCATMGNKARTECGKVVDTNFDECSSLFEFRCDSRKTDGLFRVQGICSIRGDSGSPMFSGGSAQGILVWSDDPVRYLSILGPDSRCFSAGVYISEAQSKMNVNVITR